MSVPFTPEQEERIAHLIREALIRDQVRRSGYVGEEAETYEALIRQDLGCE